MASKPAYAGTPRIEYAQVSAANTNRDGATGTYVSVFDAGSAGSRLDRITVKATGSTTAGSVRLFVSDGSTKILWKEVVVEAASPGADTPTFEDEILSSDDDHVLPLLVFPSGYSLWASTHNAETFNVIAEGGDF